jgi:LacI family transcriptional regulator
LKHDALGRIEKISHMPVRMMDVAERAGVSVTTVSHVLNKTRPVAQETEERVFAAMRDLHYYANSAARRLARGWSDSLGLIISDIENPFFPELIKSFDMTAARYGFESLLGITNYAAEQAQRAVRRMIENKVRGVAVMTSQFDPALVDDLLANGIAVVLLDSGPVQRAKNNIHIDYAHGVREAIAHLYELGHRDIALVCGPPSRPSSIAYNKAFVEALARLKLTPAGVAVAGSNTVEGGAEGARMLLAQPDFPTAVLCSSDALAIGAMEALDRAQLRVPEHVSVIGSDDVLLARYTTPPLSTVRLPRDVLGDLAVKALHRTLRTKRRLASECVLETKLVIRRSSGRARDKTLRLPRTKHT